ncbi:MAG: beta-galactosidase [Ruminococcaceae bacterium]|nr:beta-galactosidase [Oscillospiraceae bacterium]
MIKMNIPRPEHPNPQFERENWVNLNGEWEFELDRGVSGRDRKFYERESLDSKIIVPFCPESVLSGIGNTDFLNCVWYLKRVKIKKCNKRVILHFGAVDYESYIYINKKQVYHNIGGYVGFDIDITDYVEMGKENIITVCAIDTHPRGKASGKQSKNYYSMGCDYTRTTGIWQTVWLEYVEKNYIKSVKYYTSIEDKSVQLEIETIGNAEFGAVASYKGKNVGEVSAKLREGISRLTLKLSEVHLWEAGHGRLYDLELFYGKDKVKSYFGIRTTAFDNKNYLLNGKPLYLRTVLDQGFYKKGIYTAETDEELVKDIYLSFDAGFNGARLHQKVFEPRFLYHCDKLGYLVFGETGNWGLDYSNMEHLTPFMLEWQREIARDFNHPSIIGWCPLNETWDYDFRHQNDDFVRAMYYATKTMDTTRPCVGTSGNYQVVSDIYDLHDYIQDKEDFEKIYLAPTQEEMLNNYDNHPNHDWIRRYQKSIDFKDMALYLSEYGGIQWDTDGVGGWGYGNGPKTEEEFLDRYEYLTKTLINSPYLCGFCYTQLYDVEQEVNGLYTYERQPKFDMKKIKAITQAKKEK